ncbi:eukaryotic cytochrome b561-domain-containing protein, partial [Endogone sp. FLAS-F59071]
KKKLDAQVGLALFAITLYSTIFSTGWSLFSWHPTLMGIFLIAVNEGILTLQPTTTKAEKESGLNYHRFIMPAGYFAAIGAFAAIYYNKSTHGAAHFTSTHGKLGITTISYLLVQILFGAATIYAPALFGGVNQAKALYKYHRLSGYLVFVLVWVTAQYGVHSDWAVAYYPFPTFTNGLWYLATGLVVIGVFSRVHLSKLGIRTI